MRYGSVCSGIEAATAAWHPLGWKASFFSEIEAFPRSVLAHHYPETPLHGDFTTIRAGEYEPIDLLVGGTPCQSFSVAGLRGGLDDDRGNLALEYLRLADRLRPRWLVWENVPGVLSSNGGRDFGAILGGMVELGYGVAYRVLDAQFFGVAQRRRRVFVVGYLGDWRRAASVLFERHSLSGNPAPRREAGPGVAALTANGVGTCGADDNQGQAGHLIAHSLRGEGFDASEDGKGRGTPIVPVHAIQERAVSTNINAGPQGAGHQEGLAYTLEARNKVQAVAFTCSDQSNAPGWERPFAPTLNAQVPNDTSNIQIGVRIGSAVRRLTPRECERLQGFPDDYTVVSHRGKPAADGPRYKALGNSMAVPCMAWIGQRIQAVEDLAKTLPVNDTAPQPKERAA
jgi:DNA (cytosine-5)-methyltransferase 1